MGKPITPPTGSPPVVSIVIPVHNEQRILRNSVDDLCRAWRSEAVPFEIVLAENGSRDDTLEMARAIARERPEVQTFSHPEPNYGGALRAGIARARAPYVICEEIDLCDIDFHRRALAILQAGDADFVVGSKVMAGARDTRPLQRRLATQAYNRALRCTLGFRGTDTHGLKAFRRDAALPVIARCIVEHDVFASELLIRAERDGLRVLEIPVEIKEKRPPSVHLLRRVPRVVLNLARLIVSIHVVSRLSPNPSNVSGDRGDGAT